MSTSVIVLAAGFGSRMLSETPKVLHPIGGAPMIAHVLASVAPLDPASVIVVTGRGAAAVEEEVRRHCPEARFARQEPLLGTGHAALQALPLLDAEEETLILFGDTPLLSPETLGAMQAARAAGDELVVLGFEAADPEARYGRLIVADGALTRIVEWQEATPAERAAPVCNSGVMLAGTALLRALLPRIGNANAKGEYYLTDLVALARAAGARAGYVLCAEAETMGINTRADLAAAEAAFQARRRREMLENGVTLTAPETVFFAPDTAIGSDSRIGPHVVFGPGVTVENGAEIRAFCHLEGCHISEGAIVGPFARLRPGAEIGEDAHVGNFVEVKETRIGRGAKANHLAYLGDAEIGAGANIGAGTITCNFDGVAKHRTEIGARAFIGSNSALVAPVTIGESAVVAAGSVITQDVPDGALAVARGRQAVKPGLGRRLMERLREAKARRTRGSA